MTEEEFEQEVRYYQRAVVEAVAHVDPHLYWSDAVPELSARFNALTQSDLSHARRLCGVLLAD